MRLIKGIALLCLIVFYLLGALILSLIHRDEDTRRSYLVRWMHYIAPSALRVLDIHYSVLNSGNYLRNHNGLIVANHVSYLDVVIIAALVPTVFVTSIEVKHSFLGIFARAAGCLFVERRSRLGTNRDIKEIASILAEGFNVVLFPEGTSSPGKQVLPFKKSLFASATMASVNVLPLCLNYRSVNGQDTDSWSADQVFYYGSMNFGPHIWGILNIKHIWVEIGVLPEVITRPGTCRKMLANTCHSAIQSSYISIPEVVSSEWIPALA